MSISIFFYSFLFFFFYEIFKEEEREITMVVDFKVKAAVAERNFSKGQERVPRSAIYWGTRGGGR